MGPLDAIAKIPKLLAVASRMAVALRAHPRDLIVLVDFGAFNLRLARMIRMLGSSTPMLYYFPPAAWLGIQGVAETSGVAKGVRVLGVHPQSPAEEAKIKGGDRSERDVILAVDSVPVTSPEALADAIRAHGVGDKVPITLFSQGKYREVSVVLRAAPEKSAAPPPPANPAELPSANEPPPPALPPPARRPPQPPTHH